MITFKDLRNHLDHIKARKSGLQHPENIDHSINQQRMGKELNSVSVPIEVHDEFKGKKGRHVLKPDEAGKYNINKGEVKSD